MSAMVPHLRSSTLAHSTHITSLEIAIVITVIIRHWILIRQWRGRRIRSTFTLADDFANGNFGLRGGSRGSGRLGCRRALYKNWRSQESGCVPDHINEQLTPLER
jgi:hypothetical protein